VYPRFTLRDDDKPVDCGWKTALLCRPGQTPDLPFSALLDWKLSLCRGAWLDKFFQWL